MLGRYGAHLAATGWSVVGRVGENVEGQRYALQDMAGRLVDAGRRLYERGWVPATSGNFSARLDDGRIAITVSGRHKGELVDDDIMLVDADGDALDSSKRPSAETLLHVRLYRRFPDAAAVLHTHSVNDTLISRTRGDHVALDDYELLKAFRGVNTHDARIRVPIFDNDQDMVRLADRVDAYMDAHPELHAYLIAGHGLYTWGTSLEEALRHLEALEFLFECEMRLQGAVMR